MAVIAGGNTDPNQLVGYDDSWGRDALGGQTYQQLATERNVNLSGFDPSAYLQNYADLAGAGVDTPEEAYRHYVLFGANEGRSANPNAAVSTGQDQTQVAAQNAWGVDALGGKTPQQLMLERGYIFDPTSFDSAGYMSAYSDLASQGIDTPEEAAAHYALYGQSEGRMPDAAQKFNEYEYLLLNPDVAKAKANALEHYQTFGQNEGRKYDIANFDLGQEDYNWLKNFDANYYLQRRPDVKDAGADALEHYLTFGAKEGNYLNPQAEFMAGMLGFDPKHYMDSYEDIRNAVGTGGAISPLQHYLTFGRNEGRSPYEGWTAPAGPSGGSTNYYDMGKNYMSAQNYGWGGNMGMGYMPYTMPYMGYGMPSYGMSSYSMPSYGYGMTNNMPLGVGSYGMLSGMMPAYASAGSFRF